MSTPTLEQAYVALRAGGLQYDDRDLARLFDLSAPDFVAKAKAAKPALFHRDTGAAGHFDARSAPSAEVEARLSELKAAELRRLYAVEAERAIRELRGEEPRLGASTFDARSAPSADVEARLAQLTGGY